MTGEGCDADTSNTAQIQVVPDPIVTSPCGIPDTVCQTPTGAPSAFDPLTTSPSGGVGNYLYQWYLIGNTTPVSTSQSYTPPSDVVGTYQYFCVVSQNPTSANCSVNTDTCTLIVNPGPQVNTPAQDDSVCVGGIVNNLTVNPIGPGNITYQWFLIGTTNTLVDTTATYNPPTNNPGVYEYFCTVSFSSGGCQEVNSSIITIVVMPDPVITIEPLAIDSICNGGVIATDLFLSLIHI